MRKILTVALGVTGLLGSALLVEAAGFRTTGGNAVRPSGKGGFTKGANTARPGSPQGIANAAAQAKAWSNAMAKANNNNGGNNGGGGSYNPFNPNQNGNNNNWNNWNPNNNNNNNRNRDNGEQYSAGTLEGEAAAFLRNNDADRNGVLSPAESAMNQATFTKVDGDGNGTLSLNELIGYAKAVQTARAEANPKAAPAAEGAEKVEAPKPDYTLAAKIRKALTDAKVTISPSGAASIIKAFKEGKVVVTGVVVDDDTKTKAEETIKGVEGVSDLDIEKLTVKGAKAAAN